MILYKPFQKIEGALPNSFYEADITLTKTRQRFETVKLLEENTREKFLDTGIGNDLLDITPKWQATKAKLDKWDCIKLKGVFTAKEMKTTA